MKSIKILLCIPIIALTVFLPFANRIEPYVLGMPFLLFWIAFWMVLSSAIIAIVYKFDPENQRGDGQ